MNPGLNIQAGKRVKQITLNNNSDFQVKINLLS